MKNFLIKFFGVAISCIALIFVISTAPDFGRTISDWNAKKQLVQIDDELSASIFGGIYNQSKKEIAESITIKKIEEPVFIEKEEKQVVLTEVKLVRVVDGDTIIVSDVSGEQLRIRLIGINTPESVHSDESKNNEYGYLASSYVKNLIKEDQTLYLEFDEDKIDDYDRTLAYVWISDNYFDIHQMLNAIIINNGYAEAMTIEPNTKYAKEFEAMEMDAFECKRGLWDIGFYEFLTENN